MLQVHVQNFVPNMFVIYGPGNTVTDHPLAIEKVPQKALKYENRP